jgi:hypothetical protein
MELEIQSLFELHVHSCTHWLRPRNPPHLGSYTRALLVSQDRRHLFVNCDYLLAIFLPPHTAPYISNYGSRRSAPTLQHDVRTVLGIYNAMCYYKFYELHLPMFNNEEDK